MVRFRIIKEVTYKGLKYPRNTIFMGKCEFGQERLFVTVTNLPDETGLKTIKVNLALHDTDLNEGISAPIDLAKEASNEELTNVGLQTLTNSLGAAGQIASGTGQIIRKASGVRQKVFIHDGDPVQFIEIVKSK